MNVHNIMEEKVFNHVNDLYNQMKDFNLEQSKRYTIETVKQQLEKIYSEVK